MRTLYDGAQKPGFSQSESFKMGALLLARATVVGWRMRRHWREQFTFDRLEWVAIGVFGLTLFTRFWIIRGHPYPCFDPEEPQLS